MGYSKAIYNEAMEEKRQLRQKNDLLRERMLLKLYNDVPRVREIDNELKSMGPKIANATLSGNKEALNTLKDRAVTLHAERESLFSAADYEVPFSCEKCRDEGVLNNRYCDCTVKLARLIQLKMLNQSAPFEDSRFDNFSLDYYPKEASGKVSPRLRMEKVKAYLENFAKAFPTGENLLLVGGTGLGKTHLSIATANAVIDRAFGVFYASAEDLLNKLQREKFSRATPSFSFYDAVAQCDLLVLDDLGTEFLTAFGKTAIYEVINSRILSKKSTIINTNLSMEEIQERYSQRIASRLIGNYTPLLFDGRDIRQIIASQK